MRYCIFLICLASLYFLMGCKKARAEHAVQGQLFACSSNITIANRRVAIYQHVAQGNGDYLCGEGKTDANGKFDFRYTSDNIYYDLDFVLDNGVMMSGLSHKKDITNLNIYRLETSIITPLVVNLNVLNPYTNNDTLNFYDTSFTSNTRKIAGPFTSGRAFSQVYEAGYSVKRGIDGNEIEYRCGLNKSYSEELRSFFSVPFATRCESDTAYVTININ